MEREGKGKREVRREMNRGGRQNERKRIMVKWMRGGRRNAWRGDMEETKVAEGEVEGGRNQ